MMMTIAPWRLSLSRLNRVCLYHSLADCRCARENASSGFNTSSIIMTWAPRPVSTPPVEVASP
jgi:hypothetical protein